MDYQNKSKEELILELKELQKDYDSLQKSIAVVKEFKKADEDLQVSEKRFRHIFEYSSVGICFVSTDGRFIHGNKALEELLWYNNEELIKLKFNEITHPDDVSVGYDNLKRMLTDEIETATFEKRYIRKDGKVIFAITSTSLIKEEEKPQFFVTQIIDITERKQAELKLMESETRYSTIFRSHAVSIGISRILDNKYIEVNDTFLHLFGYNREEVIGHTSLELRLWPNLAERDQLIKIVKEQGYISYFESTFRKKTGEIGFLQISAELLELSGQQYLMGSLVDITERKENELNFRETEQRLISLFEASSNPIFIVHVKTKRFVDANNAACKLYGYSKEEILQLKSSDISAEPEKTDDSIDKSISNISLRYHKKKDGTIFPVEITGGFFEQNKESFHTAFVHDITKVTGTLEALRTSEKRYSNLFENMVDGLAYCQMIFEENQPVDFIYLAVNASFENLTGLKDVTGKRVTEVIPGIRETDNDLFEIYGRVALTGIPEKFEIYLEAMKMWFLISVYSPEKEHFVAVFDVITQRKKTEAALVNSESKLRQAQKVSNVGSWTWYLKTGLVELSDQMYVIYGLDKSTFKGNISEAIASVIHPEDRFIIGQMNQLIMEQGNASPVEFRIILNDGVVRTIWTEIGEVIPDAFGKPEIATGTSQDITDRKLIEKELVNAKEKAEESDRLKTAFLQNMSHEIRTPMNAIMGFSQLIVRNYNNKPKLERFSEIVNQRCNDLLEIINDILEIAKIESGQMPVTIENCDLNKLLAELTFFFTEHQKRIGKDQIKFSMQSHCELSEYVIATDSIKLKQIFINLIGNAFKFTERGIIEVGCKVDSNQRIIFYVKDTGIGIPMEKQQLIFERFTQLKQKTNLIYGGTGLGLSIVKGLVGILGGEIWLESEPEHGTTFYFSLPYKPSTLSASEPLIIQENEDYQFTDKAILIVEDDLYNSEYIKEVLSDTGLKIYHAISGKEAIQIATSTTIDLVLMDIRLPDITGYEAISQIRLYKPNLKIVAQTAYATPEDKQRAFDAGCIDYISKPLKNNLLLSMIAKHLSKQ